MTKKILLSHILRVLFFILIIYGLKSYSSNNISLELYKNLFILYIIIHFFYNSSVYKKSFNTEKFKNIRFTLYYYLQILLILIPFHYSFKMADNENAFFLLWTYFFTFIFITCFNDHFEFNILHKAFIENETFNLNNTVLILKNFLLFAVIKSIFLFLYLPNLLKLIFNIEWKTFNILFFYLFFSYMIIYFLKLLFLFYEISEQKTNFMFIFSIIHIFLLILFSVYILKTPDFYRYIYGLIISSVLIIIFIGLYTTYLKFNLKIHYKYYWKIITIFLAYYTFIDYFTYQSLISEFIVRFIYFLTIFLSIYLCQCYTFDEEDRIKKYFKNNKINFMNIGTEKI